MEGEEARHSIEEGDRVAVPDTFGCVCCECGIWC